MKKGNGLVTAYRTVFMGTPEFAVPSLDALAGMTGCEVVGVVTQPDRPAGRGRRLTPPPVKIAAAAHGLPVLQIATFRDADARARLAAWRPDVLVVAAFGLILGRKTLAIPRIAAINVHASLLPAYRGASPIAASIVCGETETGVTLMRMDAGLDTGPVYAADGLPIAPDDTTATLTNKLAWVGARLLHDRLPAILAGDITAADQIGPATLTRPLTKADGWLDWSRPAAELERRVRAMTPWPRSWTTMPNGTQVLVQAAAARGPLNGDVPGTTAMVDGRLCIACAHGSLEIVTAQLAGGRPMSGAELARGRKLATGDVLGQVGAPSAVVPLLQRVS